MKKHSRMVLRAHLLSTSTGWVRFPAFRFDFNHLHNFLEGSDDEAPGVTTRSPGSTNKTALQPQPVGTTQQPAHVSYPRQSKNPKKRPITPTESSDEEDVDMDVEGNSSSGSSVDPDELPTKRLRTSTVITRGSKDTISPSTVCTDVASPSEISDVASDRVDMLTPPPLPPSGMDITSTMQSSQKTSIPVRTPPPHVQQVTLDADAEPSPQSLNPRLDVEPEIPAFLMGKRKIHSYLSSANEPGFKVLLANYIAFELADQSGIHGALPTDGRPKAVAWWSSRARPNKLPPYDSFSSFTDTIVQWWISMQPDWRRGELRCGRASRDEGRFESLYQPGINGLLNVVILVYWWASISEERGEPIDVAYHWLIADVTWVLTQLTHIADEGEFGCSSYMT
jgi:hypothetical protein